MLDLELILLPKVRNIFLSFPVSESKGQNSHRGSVVHSNAKKREQHSVQLIPKISENCFTLMVSKNVSFQAYLMCKQLFVSGKG